MLLERLVKMVKRSVVVKLAESDGEGLSFRPHGHRIGLATTRAGLHRHTKAAKAPVVYWLFEDDMCASKTYVVVDIASAEQWLLSH
jgi:hypothetical protein